MELFLAEDNACRKKKFSKKLFSVQTKYLIYFTHHVPIERSTRTPSSYPSPSSGRVNVGLGGCGAAGGPGPANLA